jgi:glycosyltransferase involved in cell wall biosynthesis
MKIVHYYPRAVVGDGGCTAAVRGWASGLADVGASVALVYEGNGTAPGRTDGIEWRPLPHTHLPGAKIPRDLGSLLGEADLLILHSGWVAHNVVAARAAIRSGIPYVITPHGAYDPNVFGRRRLLKAGWWLAAERRLLMRSAAVHVFFEAERAHLDRLGYRGRVLLAPNGVSLPTPPTATDAQRRDHVLWMGRFDVETKGLDLLLRAHALIPESDRPELRLVGPDWRGGKQRTGRLIDELGLQKWVVIRPAAYGREKWSVLQECGVFVYPSRWDASSMMVLEAAGVGCPVVASSAVFVARELAHDDAALIVDPRPEDIAAGMLAGLTAEGRRAGATAARVVGTKFTWPSVASALQEQFRALL